ncbi:hypothetical protein CHGG_07509 [Chaetomium globosum CBS 148.51]|uniref:Uncharacterized protein n=1 Tax=Chaetomium globosum (strain ATCC 6205 / CBS 148.51 / DSM 1962 / NBRC 6347 / NRRL 1970) TaxID=306901 RepID=Q2GWZ5_CHAGB|nr:uncharacterized protein CHGG_07509 [Chaetomium globosum CBS 148.51]EAQ86256.1 hypothetical protein CHGG_07509 [Chaetomium globosum CBS 148.51]
MDDPWGSPWAATDPDRDLKPGSPAKSDIAPPPRAFLSASSSPRIPAVSEQSPWGGDDNGSGEWTAAAETPAHSIWAGGWGGFESEPTGTPHETTCSTKLVRSHCRGTSLLQSQPMALCFTIIAGPVGQWFFLEDLGLNLPPPRVCYQIRLPNRHAYYFLGALGIEHQVATTPVAAPGSDVRLSVESTTPNRGYQSPTPSNDNTDHEDERQDSPITSIDEEPRGLSAASRKASVKGQELVVKFDGIARAASEERGLVIVPTNTSSSAAQKGDGLSDAADFGKFEDVNADGPSPPSPSIPKVEPTAEEPTSADAPEPLSPSLSDNFSSGPSAISQFGPIHFGVDFGLVAKLFNTPVGAASDHDVDHEVPDHFIEDSFTTISERKTWYRISRLGSSRRHNAGDDDSYRRVAWGTSVVHDDTIKIVRRWMEEDSIAGRVALGGGISKTQKNMFGWDSSVEPVTLDDVFRKKSPHSRAFSVQQPPRAAGLSLHLADGPSKRAPQRPAHHASNSAGPGVPSFGWNTTSPTTTTHTRSISVMSVPPTTNLAGPTAQIHPAAQGAWVPDVAAAADNDDEDDDEWGEMVSSPVAASQPQPIPVRSVTHIPAGGSTPAASVPQHTKIVNHTPAAKDTTQNPLDKADVSAFESTLAKSGPQVQALDTIPELVDHSTPGPTSDNSASARLMATTTNNPPVSSTSITTQLPPTSDPQHEHEKTAQWIIANLPDLSYMLR